MYYPEEIIEEVRQRNDIVDIISGYMSLQKKGANYVCCCPFHGEKTPSFYVSRPKQIYKCFGCGEGGNVTTFIMKYENCTFPEAIKLLADKAGMALPETEYSDEARRRENRRQKLLEVNREAATLYYWLLRSDRGAKAKEYLDKRGISDEIRKSFALGFAPINGEEMIAYLRQKGFGDELIRDSGIAKHDERRGLVTHFWNRVIFPIMDINHRVIGFGGRVMGNDEKGPKYLNSPETEIFEKSRVLYGMNHARTSRTGNIILCEGYMDVISMHQAGFTQAAASLGTSFTPGHAGVIKKYTKDVLLAYDSDGAGVKAALRAIGILRNAGMSCRVIDMSPYKDPDEFIKNRGREAFQERINTAENSFMFEIRMLERDFDMNDPEDKTDFYNNIARKLCDFSEDVERENYIEAVAGKYHMGFENLRKLVVNMAAKTGGYAAAPIHRERPRHGVGSSAKNAHEENAKKAQRLLFTWLAEDARLYEKIKGYISFEDFSEGIYRDAAKKMFDDIEKNELRIAGIVDMFEDEKAQSEAASLFMARLPDSGNIQEREKALHDILVSVKRSSYEYYLERSGVDITALSRAVEGKKALEELNKTHISLREG